MEIDEICGGCSQHVGCCMCSITLGPEGGMVNRPNPINLAGKLRIIAGEAKRREYQTKTQSVPEQIRKRAETAAKGGRYQLHIWLSEFNLTKESAEIVAEELGRDGFRCEIKDEITSMYSNTDWDSEYQLTVSW